MTHQRDGLSRAGGMRTEQEQSRPDSIDSRITATPADCERAIFHLRVAPRTLQGLHDVSKIPLARLLDALEKMQERGAVRAEGALWFAKETQR